MGHQIFYDYVERIWDQIKDALETDEDEEACRLLLHLISALKDKVILLGGRP